MRNLIFSFTVISVFVLFACNNNPIIQKLLTPPDPIKTQTEPKLTKIETLTGNFKQSTAIEVDLEDDDLIDVEICRPGKPFYEIAQLQAKPKKSTRKAYCIIMFETKTICFYNVSTIENYRITLIRGTK